MRQIFIDEDFTLCVPLPTNDTCGYILTKMTCLRISLRGVLVALLGSEMLVKKELQLNKIKILEKRDGIRNKLSE